MEIVQDYEYSTAHRIAEGPTSAVYLGRSRESPKQLVAVKKFKRIDINAAQARFNCQKSLSRHRSIVLCLYSECREGITEVYEFCDSKSLDEALKSARFFPESGVRSIAIQLMSALSHLNAAKIQHNNLSCRKVLFHRGNTQKITLKINDFSNAVFTNQTQRHPADDLEALGEILFKCATGVNYKDCEDSFPHELAFGNEYGALSEEFRDFLQGLLFHTQPFEELRHHRFLEGTIVLSSPSNSPLPEVSELTRVVFEPLTCPPINQVVTSILTHSNRSDRYLHRLFQRMLATVQRKESYLMDGIDVNLVASTTLVGNEFHFGHDNPFCVSSGWDADNGLSAVVAEDEQWVDFLIQDEFVPKSPVTPVVYSFYPPECQRSLEEFTFY